MKTLSGTHFLPRHFDIFYKIKNTTLSLIGRVLIFEHFISRPSFIKTKNKIFEKLIKVATYIKYKYSAFLTHHDWSKEENKRGDDCVMTIDIVSIAR